MWKTGDPDTSKIATPKRVGTYRPKHSDTSLSREWRINLANKKNKKKIIINAGNSKQYQQHFAIATASLSKLNTKNYEMLQIFLQSVTVVEKN